MSARVHECMSAWATLKDPHQLANLLCMSMGGPPSPRSDPPRVLACAGGEYRKSFHSYPSNETHRYAQLVESPVSWAIQPMQIDTKNRDGSMDEPGAVHITHNI